MSIENFPDDLDAPTYDPFDAVYDNPGSLGDANPFSGMNLSEEDQRMVAALSGGQSHRDKIELEELRNERARHKVSGLIEWNTSVGQEILEGDLAAAGRFREEVWFGYLDIDYLKHINERNGGTYTVGNHVIKALAESIEDSIRASDRAFSFGADECFITLRGMNHSNLGILLEAISAQLDSKLKILVENGDIPKEVAEKVSCSGAFTRVRIEKDYDEELRGQEALERKRGVMYESPSSLLERSQKMGIVAKSKSGRNTVIIGPNIPGIDNNLDEAELGEAIKFRNIKGYTAEEVTEGSEENKIRYS